MKKNKKRNIILILLIILMLLLTFMYIFIISYSVTITNKYKNKMYPNVYISNVDISNTSMKNVEKIIDNIYNEFNKKKIIINAGNRTFEYSTSQIGINIDKDELIKKVKSYHDDMPYSKRIDKIFNKDKKVFSYPIKYNKEEIKEFVISLKDIVNTSGSDGKLVMDSNRNLSYQKAISAFELDIDKTYEELLNYVKKGIKEYKFSLVGNTKEFKDDEILKQIDTKVSTYSTNYNTYISRGRNLENALNYLDGTIVNSGEVFSYFKIAGPYNKKGYVYYGEMKGNGVCQIASTIYNTALLSGVEIVKRYQHQEQMTYVPAGLDATVTSFGNSSGLDFQFKNTYKYPIYISAFYNGGVATIEFWSNNNAKEGKEYKTSSEALGNRTYQTYLHTYQNGVEIDVKPIAKSRYIVKAN